MGRGSGIRDSHLTIVATTRARVEAWVACSRKWWLRYLQLWYCLRASLSAASVGLAHLLAFQGADAVAELGGVFEVEAAGGVAHGGFHFGDALGQVGR